MQIQSGSLLKLKYGAHDNRNLLLSYGFITPNNPSDRFEFTFSLNVLMVRNTFGRDAMQCSTHTLHTLLPPFVDSSKLVFPPSAQPLIRQYAPDSPSELADWQQEVLLKLGFTVSELSATSIPAGQRPGEEAFTPDDGSINSGDSSGGDSRYASGPAEPSARLFLRPAGNHDTPELQVVDPRLLAALRIMTQPPTERAPGAVGGSPAEDVHRSRICAASLGQLGDWRAVPLGEAHELLVLKVLTALCAALYTSMGTTLQQDRALQRELEKALLAGLSPEGAVLEGLVPEGTVLAGLFPEGSLLLNPGCQLLEGFDRTPPSSAGSVNGDVLMAVLYRISIKRCLEGALQAVLSRTRGEGYTEVRGVQV